MIDCKEFRNYLIMAKAACDHAADHLDNGDSISAEQYLRKIERLINAARTCNRPFGLDQSVQCPYCKWGFFPTVIDQHIREKHS